MVKVTTNSVNAERTVSKRSFSQNGLSSSRNRTSLETHSWLNANNSCGHDSNSSEKSNNSASSISKKSRTTNKYMRNKRKREELCQKEDGVEAEARFDELLREITSFSVVKDKEHGKKTSAVNKHKSNRSESLTVSECEKVFKQVNFQKEKAVKQKMRLVRKREQKNNIKYHCAEESPTSTCMESQEERKSLLLPKTEIEEMWVRSNEREIDPSKHELEKISASSSSSSSSLNLCNNKQDKVISTSENKLFNKLANNNDEWEYEERNINLDREVYQHAMNELEDTAHVDEILERPTVYIPNSSIHDPLLSFTSPSTCTNFPLLSFDTELTQSPPTMPRNNNKRCTIHKTEELARDGSSSENNFICDEEFSAKDKQYYVIKNASKSLAEDDDDKLKKTLFDLSGEEEEEKNVTTNIVESHSQYRSPFARSTSFTPDETVRSLLSANPYTEPRPIALAEGQEMPSPQTPLWSQLDDESVSDAQVQELYNKLLPSTTTKTKKESSLSSIHTNSRHQSNPRESMLFDTTHRRNNENNCCHYSDTNNEILGTDFSQLNHSLTELLTENFKLENNIVKQTREQNSKEELPSSANINSCTNICGGEFSNTEFEDEHGKKVYMIVNDGDKKVCNAGELELEREKKPTIYSTNTSLNNHNIEKVINNKTIIKSVESQDDKKVISYQLGSRAHVSNEKNPDLVATNNGIAWEANIISQEINHDSRCDEIRCKENVMFSLTQEAEEQELHQHYAFHLPRTACKIELKPEYSVFPLTSSIHSSDHQNSEYKTFLPSHQLDGADTLTHTNVQVEPKLVTANQNNTCANVCWDNKNSYSRIRPTANDDIERESGKIAAKVYNSPSQDNYREYNDMEQELEKMQRFFSYIDSRPLVAIQRINSEQQTLKPSNGQNKVITVRKQSEFEKMIAMVKREAVRSAINNNVVNNENNNIHFDNDYYNNSQDAA